jgi:hypothetical protein
MDCGRGDRVRGRVRRRSRLGSPAAAVTLEAAHSEVAWVLPGGPVWGHGIRPGQTVIALRSGFDPMQWRLETKDSELTYATSYEAGLADLRAAVWPSLAALLLATVAWLSSGGFRWPWAWQCFRSPSAPRYYR